MVDQECLPKKCWTVLDRKPKTLFVTKGAQGPELALGCHGGNLCFAGSWLALALCRRAFSEF